MIWNLLNLSLLVLSYSTIQDHHQYHHPPQPPSSSSLSLSSSSSTLGSGPIQYMWPLSLTFLIIWWLHGQTHSPQHLMYPTSIHHIAHRCHQCQTYGVFQTKISFSTNVILTISCKVHRVLAQKDCHRAAFTPKVRLLHTRQRSHYQITIIIINIIIRVSFRVIAQWNQNGGFLSLHCTIHTKFTCGDIKNPVFSKVTVFLPSEQM